MAEPHAKETRREDYRPPAFRIPEVALDFRLAPRGTVVRARLQVERADPGDDGPLRLDGGDLRTRAVRVDGRELDKDEYRLEDEALIIPDLPARAEVETEVEIDPAENTRLMGLYLSNGVYCTQCEAEGFRRITWFLDRPDVMARYMVRVEADREACPVLLSNGNLVDEGTEGDRHWKRFEDPFPKPSYLFALVAGDLGGLHDVFTTRSGRDVQLGLYSEPENVERLAHAMECLKKAMRWDEERFGLEYDLDVYHVVAVSDFNMGAMENKSLNLFNSAYVLARPESATDADFDNVLGVVGHEYFHNWTGNRVTCRDWFQLTLKEGLTVFRDQSFSADMGSAAVKRIEDVRGLRARQFAEDAGPMAHPVRPEAYVSMDNFYTVTVYQKGAEVVRMYEALLGRDGFRRGLDLYFERHDGTAVTCDDFLAAMADANDRDLGQFARWYAQAGTPEIRAEGRWEEDARRYRLRLSQRIPGHDDAEPLHVPVAVGLLGQDGEEIAATRMLELREREQEFLFEDLAEEPIPSVLRGFSAPVRVRLDRSLGELAFLAGHDTDAFNRWDAGQELAMRVLLEGVRAVTAGRPQPPLAEEVVDAFGRNLRADDLDRSLQAYALRLPDEDVLAEELEVVDPDAVHAVREAARATLAKHWADELRRRHDELGADEPYAWSPEQVGRRRLRNLCLQYLQTLPGEESIERALGQLHAADNMTDEIAALACLCMRPTPQRDEALTAFAERWGGDALVMDKWFAVQAASPAEDTLERVQALTEHEAFSLRNPNRARALLRTFAQNAVRFHAADGSGYRFLADHVAALDRLNPQVAARLASAFTRWQRFDENRRGLQGEQLERLRQQPGLSKDTAEIVDRCLAAARQPASV